MKTIKVPAILSEGRDATAPLLPIEIEYGDHDATARYADDPAEHRYDSLGALCTAHQLDQDVLLVSVELARLGALACRGHMGAIEVEATEGTGVVYVYDTQERGSYRTDDVLRALRKLPDGAGFEAAWQALAALAAILLDQPS